MNQAIGITGNRGFIARHLSRHFQSRGVEVHDLDPSLNGKKQDLPGQLQGVFHLAASSVINDAFDHPAKVLDNNLKSLLDALELARRVKGKFIFFSSYIYGHPQSSPITEEHPQSSLNPYMGSKLIGETIAKEFCRWSEMDLVILRPFSIYGQGLKTGRLVSDLIVQAQKSEALHVRSPDPIRDYLHVDDLGHLCEKVLNTPLGEGIDPVFNVGSGFQCSNLELAQLIASLANNPHEIRVDHVDRRGDVFEVIPSLEKVMNTFDWKPGIKLEEGLKRMLEGT